MADEIPRVNWAAFTLEQKYQWVHNGPGSDAVAPAARGLGMLAPRFAESSEAIQRALADVGLAWQGRAATAFTEQMRQTADWARRGGEVGKAGADQIHSYGGSFDTTRNRIPAPLEVGQNSFWGRRADELGTALRDTFGSTFGVQSDYTKRLAAYRTADEVANHALGEHESLTRQAVAAFPEPTATSAGSGARGWGGHGRATGAAGSAAGGAGGGVGPHGQARPGAESAAPAPGAATHDGRGGPGAAPFGGPAQGGGVAGASRRPGATTGGEKIRSAPGGGGQTPGSPPAVGAGAGSGVLSGPAGPRNRQVGRSNSLPGELPGGSPGPSPARAGLGSGATRGGWRTDWSGATRAPSAAGPMERVPSTRGGGIFPDAGLAVPPGAGPLGSVSRAVGGPVGGAAGAAGVPPLMGGAGMTGGEREHRTSVFLPSDEPFTVEEADDVVPPVLGLADDYAR